MHLLCFAHFSTVIALCDGTAFLLDLKQGAVSVLAGRGPMTLDAGVAGGVLKWGERLIRPEKLTKHISSRRQKPGRILIRFMRYQ